MLVKAKILQIKNICFQECILSYQEQQPKQYFIYRHIYSKNSKTIQIFQALQSVAFSICNNVKILSWKTIIILLKTNTNSLKSLFCFYWHLSTLPASVQTTQWREPTAIEITFLLWREETFRGRRTWSSVPCPKRW